MDFDEGHQAGVLDRGDDAVQAVGVRGDWDVGCGAFEVLNLATADASAAVLVADGGDAAGTVPAAQRVDTHAEGACRLAQRQFAHVPTPVIGTAAHGRVSGR